MTPGGTGADWHPFREADASRPNAAHRARSGHAGGRRITDVDLETRTVRVREQLIERDGGETVLAPPKSRAGRRVVGFPAVFVPELAEQLKTYDQDSEDAFLFLGAKGGFLRGSNFRRAARAIYQQARRDADRKIADALDRRIKAERPDDGDVPAPVA